MGIGGHLGRPSLIISNFQILPFSSFSLLFTPNFSSLLISPSLSPPFNSPDQLERVFLRLGHAETDDQLQDIISKFLPPVLLKLSSVQEGVRKKVRTRRCLFLPSSSTSSLDIAVFLFSFSRKCSLALILTWISQWRNWKLPPGQCLHQPHAFKSTTGCVEDKCTQTQLLNVIGERPTHSIVVIPITKQSTSKHSNILLPLHMLMVCMLL